MPDPMIVLIPDIHVDWAPTALWLAEAQWIADNIAAENIVAVIGLGDLASSATGGNFDLAKQGLDIIDAAGVPYILAPGNHDYTDTASRNCTLFKSYFGSARFSTKPWYKGNCPLGAENCYIRVDIGSRKFLIIALELFPRLSVLSWAVSLIAAHEDCETILATHGFLNGDGSRTIHGGPYSPDTYGLNADCDGQEIWDNLVKLRPHVLGMFCGHQIGWGTTSARRLDFGGNGNQVNQVFINHQEEAAGAGKDRIGLLTLSPQLGSIDMKTYSPDLDAYDPTGAYTLSCRIERRASCATVG